MCDLLTLCSPPQPPAPQAEFAGEDITEAQDPTREEEIAFDAAKQEAERGDEPAGDDEDAEDDTH